MAAAADLISNLPDEILHSIIRRIGCSKGEMRTIALSSRWRNLWLSYPVVEFYPKTTYSEFLFFQLYSITSEVFQKFHDATMKRFNQNKLLRMEALKLSIQINQDDLCSQDEDKFRSPAVEQLLELASERKAEYVDIKVFVSVATSFLCLPFGLLSNSSAKTLKLEHIRFASGNDNLLVSFNSLRSLHLNGVRFDDQRLFANLIASSPVLETLELKFVTGMTKLVVSAANLKKLEICYCFQVEEIQIAASGLRDLKLLHCLPELSSGVISCGVLNNLCLDYLTFGDEQVFLDLIAANPLLETLQLTNMKTLKKLQLSNVPNLKTLVVTYCFDLEEFEREAYELHSLHLKMIDGSENKKMLHKIELIAPQLNDLKIINYGLRMVDLKAIVCNLQYLKSLNLVGIAGLWQGYFLMQEFVKMLEFAGRKLEEFILWVSRELKEMELDADACPSVVKFLLYYDEFFNNNTIHPEIIQHLKRTINQG